MKMEWLPVSVSLENYAEILLLTSDYLGEILDFNGTNLWNCCGTDCRFLFSRIWLYQVSLSRTQHSTVSDYYSDDDANSGFACTTVFGFGLDELAGIILGADFSWMVCCLRHFPYDTDLPEISG